MFHIIYTGLGLPSCDNEFCASVDNAKHALTNDLLVQIEQARSIGVSAREINPGTYRHVVCADGTSVQFRRNFLSGLRVTVICHGNEHNPVRVYTGSDIHVTDAGCLWSPGTDYCVWPTPEEWANALTKGKCYRSYTVYATIA